MCSLIILIYHTEELTTSMSDKICSCLTMQKKKHRDTTRMEEFSLLTFYIFSGKQAFTTCSRSMMLPIICWLHLLFFVETKEFLSAEVVLPSELIACFCPSALVGRKPSNLFPTFCYYGFQVFCNNLQSYIFKNINHCVLWKYLIMFLLLLAQTSHILIKCCISGGTWFSLIWNKMSILWDIVMDIPKDQSWSAHPIV